MLSGPAWDSLDGEHRRRSMDKRADAPTVLVIDHEVDARAIYGSYLRAKGYAVYTASDGRRALNRAVDLVPDVIVLDLAMPRVDGWTVLTRLRESSWTSHIIIVVVSALTDARDAALRAGCDAYLVKPCSPEVVWLQVSALVRLRQGAGTPPALSGI